MRTKQKWVVIEVAVAEREQERLEVSRIKRGLERLSRQILSTIKDDSLRIDIATRLLDIRRLLNGKRKDL